MTRPVYRQRPVRGGRTPLPSCVLGKIWDRVDAEARFYKVSRSFVIATALGFTYGIEQDDYRVAESEAKRRARLTRKKNGAKR